jgi:hypothetical protein
MTGNLIKQDLKEKIYFIRGQKVIIDNDLAKLYEIPTKRLNESVKRNKERFPKDFMFQLTENEKEELVAICDRFKILKHSSSLPFVFTEQGVAMLSGVLNSNKAIKVNIEIMRVFISMRKFIKKNSDLFSKVDSLEKKQIETEKNIKKIFDIIEDKNHLKKQGIFFDGQVFDAYKFTNDLLKKAKKSIILIDNYIDESVLILFSELKNVKITIYTENFTEKLKLDLNKYNQQYPKIEINTLKKCHDRFLIIDNKEIYFIGASIKDLGKKWFAFSKMNKILITPILKKCNNSL